MAIHVFNQAARARKMPVNQSRHDQAKGTTRRSNFFLSYPQIHRFILHLRPYNQPKPAGVPLSMTFRNPQKGFVQILPHFFLPFHQHALEKCWALVDGNISYTCVSGFTHPALRIRPHPSAVSCIRCHTYGEL